MLTRRAIGLACAVTVFVCLKAAAALAQPFDKRTIFTFTAPVTLPGVTLPEGQYLFRLADPNTSRKVIQVLNADGTRPYGMFFTLPAERLEPASTPEVRFMETAAGTPAAIRTWWYPGERMGYEFVYPKDQARRLAMQASQPVLTTQAPTETTAQTNTSDLARVGSTGEETFVNATASPAAAAPSGNTQAGQLAMSSLSIPTPAIPPVAAPVAPAQTNAPGSTRTALPRTATQLPLLAVAGTLALLLALSLQYWRARAR